MDNAVVEQVLNRIRDEVRRRGERWTPQRESVVRILFAAEDHLTADELHKRARSQDHTISFATVYRTVKLLTDIGAVHKRQFTEGSAAFESAIGRVHHDHLVCEACGGIAEFCDPRIEALQEEVALQHGFVLRHHRMEMFGLCAACAAARGVTPERIATAE